MTTPPGPQGQGDDPEGTLLSVPSVAATPSKDRYFPGLLLSGKYQLNALIGEGGMGSVWQATNLLLELPVAIKLIRADLDRGALRARLQVEARAAAKLGHPAIVRVFDVGQSEAGDPFIVMELLQGETLGAMLEQGRIPAARAVQLLLPIIDALGMAHARGIVHRDLKPDNVMVALEDQQVQPKILDFGIAKLTDPRDSDSKLTEVGAVVGSPEYMSPEQACGRDDLDATTDIWSICVVLYEAITGKSPFVAANYNALLRVIVEDEPNSIVAHAAGDEALWQIIKHGLEKDRTARYQSMTELGQTLAAWLVGHGVLEDASGSSLESKWIGRSGEAHTRASNSASASAVSNNQGDLRRARESGDGTGVASGPFTATIRPAHPANKRLLGVAIAALALLGVSAAAISRERAPDFAVSAAQATLTPPPTRAPTPEATGSEVAPKLVVVSPGTAAPVPASHAPPLTSRSTLTSVGTVAPPSPRAAQRASAAQHAAFPNSAEPARGVPSPAAVTPAKASEPPLDLLAPY